MYPQSQRRCFDAYVVYLKSGTVNEELRLIESDWIIPTVDVNGSMKLNVTTNTTLNTNMFYTATLITAVDMVEAGSILLCKYRQSPCMCVT